MWLAVVVVVWIVLAILALRGAAWAYAIFVVAAFLWVPASAGFHLHRPDCSMAFSFDLALFSLTNYKHIVLFGVFFLMTRVQLGRRPYAFVIALAATLAVGVLLELEEGATRSGHCRVRDLVPDTAAAFLGEVVWRLWRRRSA